ncbi:MAG: osmotically inducible protein OsmC [Balneola sp.]|nr:osmotically inducible protein OsmC [Balneola sp.]|tara:strand:- start:142954 stop:143373 length:420 start_codon:yes stop_codon:yes gene_type:complete
MKIDVNWLGNDFHFEAENETSGKIRIDGNNEIGGLEGGLSPMQLLLAGAGGCSAIDVLHILEKQKQEVTSLKVEVDGDRQDVKGEKHSKYESIHMHYILEGDLDPKKVERALELSITKYCSVSKALEMGSEISYDFEIK